MLWSLDSVGLQSLNILMVAYLPYAFSSVACPFTTFQVEKSLQLVVFLSLTLVANKAKRTFSPSYSAVASGYEVLD